MKIIQIQVPSNNCDLCRFNIKNDKDNETNFCLAYMKAIIKNDYGTCVPISDCIDKNDEIKD